MSLKHFHIVCLIPMVNFRSFGDYFVIAMECFSFVHTLFLQRYVIFPATSNLHLFAMMVGSVVHQFLLLNWSGLSEDTTLSIFLSVQVFIGGYMNPVKSESIFLSPPPTTTPRKNGVWCPPSLTPNSLAAKERPQSASQHDGAEEWRCMYLVPITDENYFSKVCLSTKD